VTGKLERYQGPSIEETILTVRGQKVILDRDLAALYGVPTFRILPWEKMDSPAEYREKGWS